MGFIALDKFGRYGSFSIAPGFQFAVCDQESGNRLTPAESRLDNSP